MSHLQKMNIAFCNTDIRSAHAPHFPVLSAYALK